MNKRTLFDWCPWCGEQLPDNFVATRLMHDRMCHPEYMLFQYGIPECEHDGKTHYLKIQVEKELLLFHLEFCDECHKNIPRDVIVEDEKIVKTQSKLDGGQS